MSGDAVIRSSVVTDPHPTPRPGPARAPDADASAPPSDADAPPTVPPVFNATPFEPPRLAPTAAAPVGQAERIASIDVLRGFALLGILVMNIQSFSMPDSAYFLPSTYIPSLGGPGELGGINYFVWLVSHFLFDMKMMTLFSMLFGAGIVLMTSRAEAKGATPLRFHAARMAALLVIGLVHAYLLWLGDILVPYAVCGFVAYFFRRLPPWALLTLGLTGVAITCGLMFASGAFFTSSVPGAAEEAAKFREEMGGSPEFLATQLESYRGSWPEQFWHRLPRTAMGHVFMLPFFGPRIGGAMLIGMALFKIGVFSAAHSPRFYFALALAGFGLGLPAIAYETHLHFIHDWEPVRSFFYISQINYWASFLVALGWTGLVMLACQAGAALAPLTGRLAAVGQMAFTNYLSHTIICTTIFYGHGLGLYGKVERWQQALIVLGVWAFQLIVSPIWLRHFRFGPAEWLWRTLTYWKLQPMRR